MNEFVYGSIGGLVGTITSHPFDTLRINIQKGNAIQPFNLTWLYRGVSAPLFGIALEKTVIFGVYDHVNRKTGNPYLAGYTAGLTSVFFVTPIEKYKLHFQTQQHQQAALRKQQQAATITDNKSAHKNSTTSSATLQQPQKKPFVWKGMYRGLLPCMFREPPGYLIYFSVYDWLKSRDPTFTKNNSSSHNKDNTNNDHTTTTPAGSTNSFTSSPTFYYLKTVLYGGVAGVISWIPIYPADILKTHRQTQSNACSYWDIHRQIMSKKWGYYRGFSMAVARAFPLHAGVFLGYEWAKNNLDPTAQVGRGLYNMGVISLPPPPSNKSSSFACV